MKTKIPPFLALFFLLFSLSLTTTSCGSDDSIEPVGTTDDDPDVDPTDDGPVISDTPLLRINVGGEQVEVGGVVFEKDIYFSEPSEIFVNDSIPDVLGTEADTLYVTERISGMDDLGLSYNIPISNGSYRVKLHFAEIYWGAPSPGDPDRGDAGIRVFDVDIEGIVVLNNYDINADVGPVTAVIQTFEVTVEDGELTIDMTATGDQPKLSAIEIEGEGQINP